MLIYDFLLVIDTNLPPILHCFGDIVFDTSQIAIFQLYFASPLAFKPTDEGFPPVDPRNNFPWMSNGEETSSKIATG